MIHGTLNESDSISPSDDKEKRYTSCENCNATGLVDEDVEQEDGTFITLGVYCSVCNGEGQIEIEDTKT